MAVMPLVPGTQMVDVGKLIGLGNLLAWKITWLVLTTTSATSIFSRIFEVYCMTSIVYKYSHLPTLIFFTFSRTRSTHYFHCNFQREHPHSLHFDSQIQHNLPPFYI